MHCEKDMDEEDSTCAELVVVTEKALKDDNIAKLFLVTERVNIDQTASIAIRRWEYHYFYIDHIWRCHRTIHLNTVRRWTIRDVINWFPHTWVGLRIIFWLI
jgi:hypothetical protein